MLTIKQFLNKIKYSGKFETKNIVIYYYDRVLKTLIPINYNDFKIDGEFIIFKDKEIPLHRIREIRKKGMIIWKR